MHIYLLTVRYTISYIWSSEQLNYVEDRMEPRHGGWESEVVCIPAYLLHHCEGSEIAMGKFLSGMCGTDITCIQVYLISDVKLRSWNLVLVVLPSHVFLGLPERRPGL